jgi:hypothetical protein
MQNQTATIDRTTTGSPVDNLTYNLLQTLTSKLEAIEAYGKYMRDADGESRRFFEDCLHAEHESVEKLLQILKQQFASR